MQCLEITHAACKTYIIRVMRKLKHVCGAFHLTLSSLLTHGFFYKKLQTKAQNKKKIVCQYLNSLITGKGLLGLLLGCAGF
jgi:hypothetical protein